MRVLSCKATAVFRQEDITTRRTLVLLKPCDVWSLNLQLGQTKLLEDQQAKIIGAVVCY